ncbi:MAG TPA: hypothetical protein VJK72_01970 [Candidatus Nanoarchaeia archaeon]|nr:hypothetical protein [Candidatus Nanoarchaeia archaeon]
MSDLEDKIKRSQRRKTNRVHELTSRITEQEAARRKAKDTGNVNLPSSRLRPFYQGHDHPSEGWKREYTPRSGYRLSTNGTVRYEDTNILFGYASDTYAKLSRLPPAALDKLVEYEILEVYSPKSTIPFNKKEGGREFLRVTVVNKFGDFDQEWKWVESNTNFSPSRYGIPNGMSGRTVHLPSDKCQGLYDLCKDDERALEALQDLGIIKDTVVRVQMDKVALFCGLDGEEIPHAYAAMYDNPANRTYAQKTVLGKTDRRRKKRD